MPQNSRTINYTRGSNEKQPEKNQVLLTSDLERSAILIGIKLIAASLATALASVVLPVPGGPYNSIPLWLYADYECMPYVCYKCICVFVMPICSPAQLKASKQQTTIRTF